MWTWHSRMRGLPIVQRHPQYAIPYIQLLLIKYYRVH
jgi:hypothetical protein